MLLMPNIRRVDGEAARFAYMTDLRVSRKLVNDKPDHAGGTWAYRGSGAKHYAYIQVIIIHTT